MTARRLAVRVAAAWLAVAALVAVGTASTAANDVPPTFAGSSTHPVEIDDGSEEEAEVEGADGEVESTEESLDGTEDGSTEDDTSTETSTEEEPDDEATADGTSVDEESDHGA